MTGSSAEGIIKGNEKQEHKEINLSTKRLWKAAWFSAHHCGVKQGVLKYNKQLWNYSSLICAHFDAFGAQGSFWIR